MRKCHLIKSPNYKIKKRKKEKITESTSTYGHPHHSFIQNNTCLVVSQSKQIYLLIQSFEILYWQKSTEIPQTQSSAPPTWLLPSGDEESCKILNQMLVISLWNFRIIINLDYSKMLHICLIWKLTVTFQKCEEMKMVDLPKITPLHRWASLGSCQLPNSEDIQYVLFPAHMAPPDSPRADFYYSELGSSSMKHMTN